MKKKILLLCMAGLLCFSHTAWASPFPDKTKEIVQDEGNYLKETDRAKFAEDIKQFPDEYKVVVVESTQPEAQTPDGYAQLLYDNYNLSDKTLMIVLDINTQLLGVYAGPALQTKGAKAELLHDKITSYYEPYRSQKAYLKGIELFIAELNDELERIQEGNSGTKATSAVKSPAAVQTPAKQQPAKSLWASLPWWLYAIGILFVVLLAMLVYSFFRRRKVFEIVDAVEDWKDQIVEKINMIEVEKSLRRSTGTTEEHYIAIANRKENLLRVKIPEVEMTIIDAEESCDRFRFQLALGLIEDARDMLMEIERELEELKQDNSKVVQRKKENKLALPEIGKLFENVERKLSNVRLERGLSFHELKVNLDDVELMRARVKQALADGDDVLAYETTLNAQQQLERINEALELIPQFVAIVQKDMPEELKQLEEGIVTANQDGYDLSGDVLHHSLLQLKQILFAAQTALEEGNLELVRTHTKAFEVKIEIAYQEIEESVLVQKQVAAADALALRVSENADLKLEAQEPAASSIELEAELLEEQARAVDTEDTEELLEERDSANIEEIFEEIIEEIIEENIQETVSQPAIQPIVKPVAMQIDENDADSTEAELAVKQELLFMEQIDVPMGVVEATMSQPERDALLSRSTPVLPAKTVLQAVNAPDEEYELVIPKQQNDEETTEANKESEMLILESEDDALDDLERISGALMRIRQQIKRSYLPGVPEQLKYLFDDVVQLLARTKTTMERRKYDLEEVAMLLTEAGALIDEIERVTERVITDCQRAEGAIQYTNRYRRQNRKVNDLLTKAEQAFRDLLFSEALHFAEEARLVIEAVQDEPEAKGWLLRKKKKGAGN